MDRPQVSWIYAPVHVYVLYKLLSRRRDSWTLVYNLHTVNVLTASRISLDNNKCKRCASQLSHPQI